MKNEQILVLGGKGKTGRKVSKKLMDLGYKVRIGSRNETPAFDWENSKSWDAALAGIEKAYITFQPDLAVPMAKIAIQQFVEKAEDFGLKKLVLLSGRGEKEAQLCEDIVMNSSIDSVVVRCDWYNQNFSESFFLDPILAGHVAVPRAETKIPFVDTDDIAEVVVKSLLEDKHNGKTYELTGSRLLTFQDAINEVAAATRREIIFQAITLEEYSAMMEQLQIPQDYIWLVNYLFTEVLDGRNSSTTNVIEEVLGRKPKDFSEYVKETASTGVWAVN